MNNAIAWSLVKITQFQYCHFVEKYAYGEKLKIAINVTAELMMLPLKKSK